MSLQVFGFWLLTCFILMVERRRIWQMQWNKMEYVRIGGFLFYLFLYYTYIYRFFFSLLFNSMFLFSFGEVILYTCILFPLFFKCFWRLRIYSHSNGLMRSGEIQLECTRFVPPSCVCPQSLNRKGTIIDLSLESNKWC